jgi:uncharacterized protein YoxC
VNDLTAATKALNDIIASLKAGGWIALIAFVAILAYLIFKPMIARQRQVGQTVTVTTQTKDDTLKQAEECPLHSGVERRFEDIKQFRLENHEEHQQLFSDIKGLSVAVAGVASAATTASVQATQAVRDASQAAAAAAVAAAAAAATAERRRQAEQ